MSNVIILIFTFIYKIRNKPNNVLLRKKEINIVILINTLIRIILPNSIIK